MRPSHLMSPQTARQIAFVGLESWRERSIYLEDTFAELSNRCVWDPRERRLAVELAYGTVRQVSAIDAIVAAAIDRPRSQVEPPLWTILQLTTYQLLFCDGIPQRAAVSEGVELTRWIGRPRWTRFANGVLRSIARSITDDIVTEASSAAVPMRDAHRYRRLRNDVFPDPRSDAPKFIACAFGLPRWLVRKWYEAMHPSDLLDRAFWFNRPPRLCLRVNSSLTDRDSCAALLRADAVECDLGYHPQALWILKNRPVEQIPGFAEGMWTVQDESSMWAASLLNPRPGSRLLDLCAAPGGKTTHLAELIGGMGTLVSADVQLSRIRRVRENVRRLGFPFVQTIVHDGVKPGLQESAFDGVLVDVPCSNTGVLNRRPESRWRIRRDDLDRLTRLQQQLLRTACTVVRTEGRVVYSTCSVEPEENQGVVRQILAENPRLQLLQELTHAPGRPGDGGYHAALRRTG